MAEDLLDLVDQLSRPRTVHHKQYDQDGKYLRTATITNEALLVQLGDAVAASLGSGVGGASSLPGQRNMVDSDALYLLATISELIAQWCVQQGVTPRRGEPGDNLRKWLVAYQAYERPDVEWRAAKMRTWVGQITDKLDPPYRVVVERPCPKCGAIEWVEDNTRMLWPVIAETREGAGQRAWCRATECDGVWDGEWEVRFLSYTLG